MSNKYEIYRHHGQEVYVRSVLKGKHKSYCLCYSCLSFYPGTVFNCAIAERVYSACEEHNIVTPVWECPAFVEKEK
jgi:hypothetical protein